ncbi:uncharacterized protein LOC109704196 isoform X2 [Ananas comosus]|uniref:Uncharacterized protein LOC109704196 isoform X2 n=1 Tax=Ananas comosus TaxID=4615 RepID=A0A6P5EBP2_ANACO|nr:uncharacterized protein LOC109704196 isoform X2 [Ananas comosus]
MIFPPRFFTVMVHLVIHLASEARIAGPVHYRWMYPIERYLSTLKSFVRNRAHPEGSIAEAYLAQECMTFCSRYIKAFMAKRQRLRIVQSRAEYQEEQRQSTQSQPQSQQNLQHDFNMQVEEHVHLDQENTGHEEIETVTVEDETGRRTRGKTLLADLWVLPPSHRVVVDCNTYGQPIGNERGLLGQFLGTIARNGGLCSLSHKDWRYVKKEKKLDILNQVKKKFLYHQSCEKWIFKSAGRKWKDYKCSLKARYFDDLASLDEMYKKVLEDIVRDQWISLVNFWKTETAKLRSEKNKRSRTLQETTHTAGTKSFARVAAEMADLQSKIIENQESSNSHGRVAWEGDAYSDVIGKDKYGYMRGVGLAPSPSELLKPMISSRFDGIQITTLDETI